MSRSDGWPARAKDIEVVEVSLWVWPAFVGFIVSLLALDLFVFHREAHEVTFREASRFSLFWVSLGLSFSLVVYVSWGATAAGEYLAGYLVEEALSVDNLFVFALIFRYFAVPSRYQHRVLFWGIIGALVFRAIFIGAGVAVLQKFHWVIYVLGAFLIYTGLKMARHQDEEVHPERNPILRLFRRFIPTTPGYDGQNLMVRRDGRWLATPLFAVLVLIETTDIVFAVDSIPAILAITREPFIVFSSNAFAILGLRALYFMIAGMLDRFVYLNVGLALVLVFVGTKMVISEWYHVPIWASLTVIALTLAISVLASLRKTATPRDEGREGLGAEEPGTARMATVLFAADGSDASAAAERLLGRMADRRRVQVEVLMVNSFDAVLAQAASTQRYDPAAGRERAAGIVHGVVERLVALGLNAHGEVVDGDPAAEIVSAGARVNAGLLVLGAGRKGRLDSLLLGSTSTEVLRASDTSMLIVHDCVGEGHVDVLVGTDGSEGAGCGVEAFAACADPERCRVTVMAVKGEAPAAGATDFAGVGITEAGGNTASAVAASAAARLGSDGFSVTTEVVTGNAANVLSNRARDYELVVAGSRGLGAVKRALLGSVCDKLVRRAQAVLVGR